MTERYGCGLGLGTSLAALLMTLGCGGRVMDTPTQTNEACASEGTATLAEGADGGPWPSGATAIDDANIYWVDFAAAPGDAGAPATQNILSVSKCGGPVTTVAAGLAQQADALQGGTLLFLAADGESVYSTIPTAEGDGGFTAATGAIMVFPRAGGLAQTLAVDQSPIGIAVDEANVYWTNWMAENGGVSGSIRSAPKDRGKVTTLATTPIMASPEEILVNDAYIAWTTLDASGLISVMSMSKTGGAAITLVSNVACATLPFAAFAIDSTSAYWAEVSPDGESAWLVKAPLSGGVAVSLAPVGVPPANGVLPGNAVTSLAVDETSVYWTEAMGNVKSVSKEGGSSAILVSDANPAFPPGLMVDATSVYWVDDGGSVKKAPK
jgi:hypothetical protein